MSEDNEQWPTLASFAKMCGDKGYVSQPETNHKRVVPGVYQPKHKLREVQSNYVGKRKLRAVFKNGDFNVNQKPPRCNSHYILSLVESKWCWTLIILCAAFTIMWSLFATVYWTISLRHGDFEKDHLPQHQNNSGYMPCIKNMYGFTSAFLFSIRAYGQRAITLECPETVMVWCFQCMMTSICQAIMVGILFAKLSRPKARRQTILFSKYAIINLRNDKFCLIFRVGDMRKSKILDIKPKAYLIRCKTDYTEMKTHQIELKLDIDECESTFFLWPITAVHVIDEESPFYGLSAPDLLSNHLEILVVFEGTIESTGQPVQARTSYTETDIFWGHRFMPMVGYDKIKKIQYIVDYSKLSEIQQIDTPLCSPREYDYLKAVISDVD